jgi:aspartyl-tRNA(Asn)/glutamyl-tRNA(Gln) amidotransferase subunit A
LKSDAGLAYATIETIADGLSSGAFSAQDLVEFYLDRIARYDAGFHAFIEVTADRARDQARQIAATRPDGILAGIPFASKDMFDVSGVATTGGSRVTMNHIATRDAEVIRRMCEAGALSLGKLNLHEFAYGATGENPYFGTCPNPYDRTRMAGGSSSGSATAVACGFVPCAFGTDTGGSVRAPAALCGLVGLKPTLGRVSTRGVMPYSWSLDHIGIFARSVEDAAVLLETVAGLDPEDPASSNEPVDDYLKAVRDGRSLNGITLGVPRAFFFDHVDPEIVAATEAVIATLERAGARVIDVAFPSMEHTRTVSLTVQMPEALSYHARYLDSRGDLYGDDFRAGLALGQCIPAEHYVRAKRLITDYRNHVDRIFDACDAVVTPSTPVIAPRLGAVSVPCGAAAEPVGNAITRFTSFFNMTGHPAITVPSGMHSAGLPIGVQVIARPFEESLMMRVAATAMTAIPVPDFETDGSHGAIAIDPSSPDGALGVRRPHIEHIAPTQTG